MNLKVRSGLILLILFSLVGLTPRGLLGEMPKTQATPKAEGITPHPAKYWKKLEGNKVQCLLCPRYCILKPGERGACRVRENQAGRLVTLVYSLPCAVNVDPIEKKPFFHFLPQSQAFSIATAGCNLRCKFCQNWNIAQRPPEETQNYCLPSKDVVKLAKERNCDSIAYTYSEPVVFFEYMLETAKLAKEAGIKNIMHSAGYINEEPLRELCKYLDGVNIDLKGFTEEYYQEVIGAGIGAHLKPVLEALKIIKEEGIHLEITNLIVPTKNDNPEDIRRMCKWIKENLGPEVPIHFSRFWPQYQLRNLPPTPVKTLEMARRIAREEGLKYVYIGNVPGHEGENTYCQKCGKLLIQRIGFRVLKNNLSCTFTEGKIDGRCKFCGEKISGFWGK